MRWGRISVSPAGRVERVVGADDLKPCSNRGRTRVSSCSSMMRGRCSRAGCGMSGTKAARLMRSAHEAEGGGRVVMWRDYSCRLILYALALSPGRVLCMTFVYPIPFHKAYPRLAFGRLEIPAFFFALPGPPAPLLGLLGLGVASPEVLLPLLQHVGVEDNRACQAI